MKRVTIKDIARKVGVTHPTVSMVIHGDPRISNNTKQKVLAAMKEMNYHPDKRARSLATGKTNTIAIVSNTLSSMFGMYVMEGLESEFLKTNYDLNFYSARGLSKESDSIMEDILLERKADGVIVLSVNVSSRIMDEYRRAGVPVVVIEAAAKGAHLVKVNNTEGVNRVMNYLIGRGKKKIGLVLGNRKTSYSQKERFEAYKSTLENNGIKFTESRVYEVRSHTFNEGVHSLGQILKPGLDAVFCSAGDVVAAGIIKKAKSINLKVPKDISVIGHDDNDVASIINLTTVKQPNVEMGRKAYELVMHAIKDKPKTTRIEVFEPELILRATA